MQLSSPRLPNITLPIVTVNYLVHEDHNYGQFSQHFQRSRCLWKSGLKHGHKNDAFVISDKMNKPLVRIIEDTAQREKQISKARVRTKLNRR